MPPPLPPNVEARIDSDSGHPYYLNKSTGASGWTIEEVVGDSALDGEGGTKTRAIEERVDPDTGYHYFVDGATGIRWVGVGAPGLVIGRGRRG